MSRAIPPIPQMKFGGIDVSGHPLKRPPGTAYWASNVAVMDGNWLRLRGGRIARANATNAAIIRKIMPGEFQSGYNNQYHLCQIIYPGSPNTPKIVRLRIQSPSTFTLQEPGGGFSYFESIGLDADENGVQRPLASCNLADSVIYYNGYGDVNGSDESVPALSQWKVNDDATKGKHRYFGLYPNVAGTNPTVSFNPGLGYNKINSRSIKIYVGLYAADSAHYSNGVYAGELTSTGGAYGTVEVSDLDHIKPILSTDPDLANQIEYDELYYVFYATLEGYDVPYLIMAADLSGPYKVRCFASSGGALNNATALSLSSGTDNGWVLDNTKRMPTNNFPPRAMRSICRVNGRIYGILSPTATPTSSVYQITDKEKAGVVWSEAEGSSKQQNFVGDPQQSWPAKNFSPIPAGPFPLVLHPAPGDTDVLVLSRTRAYLLRDINAGVHTWIKVSGEHGIYHTRLSGDSWERDANQMIVTTRRGVVWVTQRWQLALLQPDTQEAIIISRHYENYLRGKSIDHIAYVYDPANGIDRVDVYFTDVSTRYVLHHDFTHGVTIDTEPSTTTTAAASLTSSTGDIFHIVGQTISNSPYNICSLYSIDGQPDNYYQIPTRDQLYTVSSGTTKARQEVSDGAWHSNWMDFGDPSSRKELFDVLVMADIANSTQLGDSPFTFKVYPGFSSTSETVAEVKTAQEAEDHWYKFNIIDRHHRYFRFELALKGHSQDEQGEYYTDPRQYTFNDIYAAIMGLMMTVSPRENRD